MITTSIETITPDVASYYLSLSGGNRNESKDTIDSYSRQMRDGEWKLNGDAIKFSDDGKLLDGHHRLLACVKAQVNFQSVVVRGVEGECFVTYDCGRHRSLGQLADIKGYRNYNMVASGARFCHKIEHGASLSRGSTKLPGIENSKMMEYIEKHRYTLDAAASFIAGCSTKSRLLNNSISVGLITYLTDIGGYDIDKTFVFFRQVYSLDSSDNKSIDLFRKRMIVEKTCMKKTPQQIIVAMLFKTWNAYVTGKTLRCIKFDQNREDFPTLILNSSTNPIFKTEESCLRKKTK